jgi:hypothetical protein
MSVSAVTLTTVLGPGLHGPAARIWKFHSRTPVKVALPLPLRLVITMDVDYIGWKEKKNVKSALHAAITRSLAVQGQVAAAEVSSAPLACGCGSRR